jgi:hypothetical protein
MKFSGLLQESYNHKYYKIHIKALLLLGKYFYELRYYKFSLSVYSKVLHGLVYFYQMLTENNNSLSIEKGQEKADSVYSSYLKLISVTLVAVIQIMYKMRNY